MMHTDAIRTRVMSTDMTRDPSILRQREMESLKRQIISRRRGMEPLMVTPKDDRFIDYRGSDSVNSKLRRILYGRSPGGDPSRIGSNGS